MLRTNSKHIFGASHPSELENATIVLFRKDAAELVHRLYSLC